MYEGTSRRLSVDIPWASSPHPITDMVAGGSDVNQIQLVNLADTPTAPLFDGDNFGHKIPYRVTRRGIKRISSTAMEKNREGALYYIDLPLVSYGSDSLLNIPENSPLAMKGRANIAGYVLEVEDENYSYSLREKVNLILPNAILPVGSTPTFDNELRLAKQSIQVTYNTAPLVSDVQALFDSPLERVLNSNSLVRHFLPMYAIIEMTYVGGSSTDIVAEDILAYISAISPNQNRIVADKIVSIAKQRSADQVVLPVTLIALVHGIDRKIRALRSTNAIGGNEVPVFKGTFQQSYFIAGPDSSKSTVRPVGEQVYLIRR
jgi:hypothetical protein